MGQWYKENPVKVGDEFLTKNGVKVTVTEYVSYKHVVVTDGDVIKDTSVFLLRNGKLSWPTGPKLPRKIRDCKPREDGFTTGLAKKYKIGAKFQSSDGFLFEIVEMTEKHLTVQFECGKRKKFKNSSNFDKANVKKSRKMLRSKLSTAWPVGSVHGTDHSGDFTVIEIIGDNAAVIQWSDTMHEQRTTLHKLSNNRVKDESRYGGFLSASGYYIYYACCGGQIVYVGMGKDHRYTHCLSGKSSCYYLNKLHFSGEEVSVGILIDNIPTAEDARVIEKFCILHIKPPGNSCITRMSLESVVDIIDTSVLSLVKSKVSQIQNTFAIWSSGFA